jgi:phage terminase large subunit
MGQVKITLNEAFRSASESTKRHRIIYGGSGSGKSHFVGQETILNMLKRGDYGYLIIRKTGRSIKHSVFMLLTSLISEYGLTKYFSINKSDMSIVSITGSTLVTSGLDDVEKLKSIVGVNRIWVEEASEIAESDFKQLDLRMRGKNTVGYQMTLTFNPISELHWIKKRFFDLIQDDAFTLKTTYRDNKFLDEAYIKRLEDLQKEDYQYYRIYNLGEWGSLGNLIFPNWKRADLNELIEVGDKKIRIRDTFDNYYNGIDFGFADDPFAFVRVHYDKKHKTIYVTDEVCQTGLFNDEASEILKPIIKNEIVTCDSAEPKSIADLRRSGTNAKPAKKGSGSVEFGIKWIQSMTIIVDNNCVNMIRELSGYKWCEDKDGNTIPRPIQINNHMIDALRYALESATTNTQWGWSKEE